MSHADISAHDSTPRAGFATTRWTVVLKADGDDTNSKAAFSELAEAYWYPLFVFLRRKGVAAEDAEDTIQSFFAWLLEKNIVSRADRQRGRFRTFLLHALQQFVVRVHRHQSAQKRRPDGLILSIDQQACNQRYEVEVAIEMSAEQQFDRAWAMATIEECVRQLEREWEQQGKGVRFAILQPFLTGSNETSLKDAANQLGMKEGAARVAVHRMRRRYGELLRAAIAHTIETEDELEDELRFLLTALAAGR
ncbi:MAG: sigma-70 family RNA polymerase sigma factor [Planctomycetes bacterium]|nr:sigma-70 family RNA polymerase sigma factor [Planctomycetota bacterium]